MFLTEAFFAARMAFSSSSSRADVTISLARHSMVWVCRERFEATKWVTRSSRVCGLFCSSGFRELALLVEDVGEGGDAMHATSSDWQDGAEGR